MPYPGVIAATPYASPGADSTSWSVFTGVDCNAGSVLLIASDRTASPIFSTASANWSLLGRQQHPTVGCTSAVFYKTADGSGDFVLTSTTAEQYTAILLRVSNGGQVSGTSDDTTNDPPNHIIAATRNALWVAGIVTDDNDTADTAPAGYGGLVTQAGVAASASCGLAYRNFTAASQNPGVFGGVDNHNSVVWTLALYNLGPVTNDRACHSGMI